MNLLGRCSPLMMNFTAPKPLQMRGKIHETEDPCPYICGPGTDETGSSIQLWAGYYVGGPLVWILLFRHLRADLITAELGISRIGLFGFQKI